jgi:hypothetical protein
MAANVGAFVLTVLAGFPARRGYVLTSDHERGRLNAFLAVAKYMGLHKSEQYLAADKLAKEVGDALRERLAQESDARRQGGV